MSDYYPYIGAVVHYMAGESDVAAMITHLRYVTPAPPGQVEVAPQIYRPSEQGLLVLAPMQQPYWTTAIQDESRAPNTWHWPEMEAIPKPPEPEPEPVMPWVGASVHYADTINHHLAATVTGITPLGDRVHLVYFDPDRQKEFYLNNIKFDDDFVPNTWHWPYKLLPPRPEPHDAEPIEEL